MSVIVKQYLIDEMKNKKYPKKLKYFCSCCELYYTTTRRDMTYPLATFLLALEDLQKAYGMEHCYYRDVIKYAKDKYKCTPSDYSILHRWKLIKSMEGVNGDKYKGLTEHGKEFINNNLRIYPSHYYMIDEPKFIKNMDKNGLVIKDGKVTFREIELAYYEKEKRKPFLKAEK